MTRASWSYQPRWEGPPTEGAFQEGEDWFIDIRSLDDLLALMNREKAYAIVSGVDPLGNAHPHITIYDDYVE